jgi:hypothetical protein
MSTARLHRTYRNTVPSPSRQSTSLPVLSLHLTPSSPPAPARIIVQSGQFIAVSRGAKAMELSRNGGMYDGTYDAASGTFVTANGIRILLA